MWQGRVFIPRTTVIEALYTVGKPSASDGLALSGGLSSPDTCSRTKTELSCGAKHLPSMNMIGGMD